ncbi:MAG: hypothetical protein P1Q69_19655 [Candidatus Thorarchaeota archaeon]|nr:hypothetical protein [Candidatus Thorarchaeota archaeon]
MVTTKISTPPINAGPTRQLNTIKTNYGLALTILSAISTLSVLLIGPIVIGLPVIGVVAVLCALGSRNLAEESLVSPARDPRIARI